jgi:hypothetical protein
MIYIMIISMIITLVREILGGDVAEKSLDFSPGRSDMIYNFSF